MPALKYWDSGSSTWKTVAAVTAGLPTGGTTSQVLSKIDATDYNTQWSTPTVYGNVSNSGTPAATELAAWTDATHIKGGTGLTVSTFSLTYSYNATGTRLSLFLNNTDTTSKSSQIMFQQSAVNLWQLANDVNVNGGANFFLRDVVGAAYKLYIDSAGTKLPSVDAIGWNAIASGGSGLDTAFNRNAAGVVEINNGTAGTYRDLILRNLTVNGTVNGGTTWDGIAKVSGSDFTTTNTVSTTVTGLATPTLPISTLYEFEMVMYVNSSDTSGLSIAVDSGVATTTVFFNGTASSSASNTVLSIGSNTRNGLTATFLAVAADGVATVRGFSKTGSSGSPNIVGKIAKTTAGTAKVYIGSNLKWRQA